MSLTHKGFYQVVDAVYSFLIARDDVSTVTIGTVNDADLNKQTVFPLVHMVPTGASRGPQVTTYGFTFYFLDWVNETKDNPREQPDALYGITDLIDVWHSTDVTLTEFLAHFQRGAGYSNNFQLEQTSPSTPFQNRFTNLLAGWEANIQITVPNASPIC